MGCILPKVGRADFGMILRQALTVFQHFLVSDSWTVLRYINDAAFLVAAAFQQMLHQRVIFMRVYPDIRCSGFAKLHAAVKNTFLSAIAGNAVYGAIGLVI